MDAPRFYAHIVEHFLTGKAHYVGSENAKDAGL